MKTADGTDRKRAGDQLSGEDLAEPAQFGATRTQDYKSNRAASFLQIRNFGAVSYVSNHDFCSRNETQAALECFESRFDENRDHA
jgi:hypothetical protein